VRRKPRAGCRCLATRSACRQRARLLGSTFVPEKGFELCFRAEGRGQMLPFSSSLAELGFPNTTSQPKYSVVIIRSGSISGGGFSAFATRKRLIMSLCCLFAVALIIVIT